jgi:hypothetical protein
MNDELRQILAGYLRRQSMLPNPGVVPPKSPAAIAGTGATPPPPAPAIPNGGFVDTVDPDIASHGPNSNASNYSIQPGRSRY